MVVYLREVYSEMKKKHFLFICSFRQLVLLAMNIT